MDLFGIKLYLEQKFYVVKQWLNVPIGAYRNIDKVTDLVQLASIAGLVVLLLNK